MPGPHIAPALMHEVRTGLLSNPKRLPPTLFYDSEGSALFEQITGLAEYYPTRTERGILERNAADMVREAGPDLEMIELGSGSSMKTHLLLQALLERQDHGIYSPIDVSGSALDLAKSALAGTFPSLVIRPIHADYLEGLASLDWNGTRRLVLFLGSTIGNFDPARATEFLRSVRGTLQPGDSLLIGMDLAKAPAILIPAYDDALGITARFNLNVLARLNREWGADFRLEAFRHVALWNEVESRIEMHLESQARQTIHIGALNLEISLDEGERIHTENSYKYRPGMGEAILCDAGWKLERTWTDEQHWFALHLARC
jgi:dimethylhistidine N-methyltransferase